MPKHIHEIRDPIHVFVRLDTDERKVVDSFPFQRLRYINQLATTYLIYPGATHKRFEHSLGVMELAGRVFDVVTHPYSIHDAIREQIPEITDPKQLGYWRSCVRMAALCHDVGHLPFSHAAEKELLPNDWDHERLSKNIIENECMNAIFKNITPPLRAEDIVKLALGPKKLKGVSFSAWETILAEIIVGDAFGVDRMDYLLRDSHHAGVPYGRFDHHRLIDTLRVLPSPPQQEKSNESAEQQAVSPSEPSLGIEEGGLHSAAALMQARFFMYTQLYFHPVRRAYDIHLKEFLQTWLPNGQFPITVEGHLKITDNEVTAALLDAFRTTASPSHDAARRLVNRDHFRLLYRRHPSDVKVNPEAGEAIYNAAAEEFGKSFFRHDRLRAKGGAPDFPVLTKDGRIASSLAMSETLSKIEPATFDFVFVDRSKLDAARQWLSGKRQEIIRNMEGQNDE